MHLTWREKSELTIGRVVRAYLAETGRGWWDLPALAPAERKELLQRVRRAYPFGQRRCYPYRAWLDAVGALRETLECFSGGAGVGQEVQEVLDGLFAEPQSRPPAGASKGDRNGTVDR